LLTNEKNQGLPICLNSGLEIAKGRYIARMDHDDISLPLRLEKQLGIMEQFKDVMMVGCWYDIIDIDTNRWTHHGIKNKKEKIEKALLIGKVPFPHGCMMFRTNLLERTGCYNEDFIFSQDFELLLRIFQRNRIYVLEEILFQLRKQPVSRLKKMNQMDLNNIALSIYHSVRPQPYHVHAVKSIKKNFQSQNKNEKVTKKEWASYFFNMGNNAARRGEKNKAIEYYMRGYKNSSASGMLKFFIGMIILLLPECINKYIINIPQAFRLTKYNRDNNRDINIKESRMVSSFFNYLIELARNENFIIFIN
jgi:glycosyltransferase involved in cell wall biosynthesis